MTEWGISVDMNVERAVAVLVERGPICERCVAGHVGVPAAGGLMKSPVLDQITVTHGMCRACRRRGLMLLSFQR